MADYKVVFRSDITTGGKHRLLWSPGSPALLTAVQLSRNTQTSVAFLQVKIRNVSGDTIRSVGCSAKISYTDGTHEDIEFEDLDVDLEQSAEKQLKPQQLQKGNVEAADVILTSVTTDDLKWRAEKDPIDVPKPDPLDLNRRAMERRRQLLGKGGTDDRAYDNSVFDSEDWWVCACGQLNVGRTVCCECGSDKGLLLSTEDETELLASADERDDAIYQKAVGLLGDPDDADALSQAADLFCQIPGWKDASEQMAVCRDTAANLRKKNAYRKMRIAAKAGAIMAVAALLVVFVIAPFVRYKFALIQIENGQYGDAATTLEDLGGYMDSKNKLVEAKYGYVLTHKDNGDDRTYSYLTELKDAGYMDSASIYSEVFDWHFEFAYDADGHVDSDETWFKWPDGQASQSASRKGRTYVDLFIRATGGPRGGTKKLKVEKQLLNGGSWSDWKPVTWKPDLKPYYFASSDGRVARVNVYIIWPGESGGDIADGGKVRVTDYDTGELFYEGEAIQP